MVRINAGFAVLAAKIGPKLLSVGIKFAKVIKIGKTGLAIGSMATYVYLFTWQFAIIIMISLFFHELGHIIAMKRCGMKTKGIYFIPFLGAAAVADGIFKSRRDEVYIAIMGPIFGFSMAVSTAFLYFVTDNALFAAAAGWMAMVNLFNLLPINPLDGGRIMKSVAFSIHSGMGFIFLGIGIVASIILTFWVGLVLFSILLFLAILELVFEWLRYSKREEVAEIYKDRKDIDLQKSFGEEYIFPPSMTKKGIIISVVAYIIIIGILWSLMTYMNHVPEVEIARKLFMS
jgi:Zn-dependent protease